MNYLVTIPEILIQLLIRTDRSIYWVIYDTYKDILESPIILKLLTDLYCLPVVPQTFADFIFEHDLRHKVWRKKIPISYNRLLNHAVKSNDLNLVNELFPIYNCSHRSFYLVGKFGNQDFINQQIIIQGNSYDNMDNIILGLVSGSHNSLFEHYYELYHYLLDEYTDQMITDKAALRKNNSLAKKYYTEDMRGGIISSSAKVLNFELLEWLNIQSSKDYQSVICGYFRGGHLQLAKTLYYSLKEPHLAKWLFNSALDSDDPELFEWFLDVSNDNYLRNNLYQIVRDSIHMKSYKNTRHILSSKPYNLTFMNWDHLLAEAVKDDAFDFVKWAISECKLAFIGLKDFVKDFRTATAEWIRREY